MLDLGQIRNEIDGIDKQLVELFEQRMKLTKEVAEYKIQTGKRCLTGKGKSKIESVTKLVKIRKMFMLLMIFFTDNGEFKKGTISAVRGNGADIKTAI